METAVVISTPATWLPEDDILLKNAVEEGASLEALAKGAVPFSRTFTLQEVQDRWHALLYDPEISAQACAHLFLYESDKTKEIKASHQKRKVGTLRKRYHERVKRIRNEFFSSADLGFHTESNLHRCTANRGDCHEQGTLHDGPQVGSAVLGDCMSDPFGLPVTNFDMLHQAFPQVMTDLAATNGVSNVGDAFHSEGPDPLVNNHMSEAAKSNCLRELTVADPPFPVQSSLRIDGMPPFQPNNIECNNIPRSLRGNSTDSGKGLLLGGELSNTNVYAMGFSPPLQSMPLWKTMEDVEAPDMPLNVVSGDKMQNAQDVSELRKKADKQNGDSFIHSASILNGKFLDLPDSTFDFSTDDMLTMNMDRKDLVDKSSGDNTGVPMNMNDNDTPKVAEKAKIIANAAIAAEPEVATSDSRTVLGEDKPVSEVKVEVPSDPASSNEPLEKVFLYCALNTEDPEIPCNDDIFLLIHPGTPNASSAKTSPISKSSMDPAARERYDIQGLNSVKKLEESSKSPLLFGSYMLPEAGHVHTGGGSTAKAELNDSYKDLALRHKAIAIPTQSKPAQTSIASVTEGNSDKDVNKVDSGTMKTSAILRELPMQIEAGGVGSTLPEAEENPPKSDQEGSESENEDLLFSDIEAMILDMDLALYDDDLHFTRRVSKYQQENSKRAIIRMEQCARASLQRSMTSQGALAVLYGRRSRHIIRKTEVILGRSTEETVVDIDLGKEGRHNKISRRQAMVKMETDGSFSLKNLAKSSMFVNGAEVGSGELIVLGPSCLIEIRGTSFVFESNQKYVKHYRENIDKERKKQQASFKLIPKQEIV